MLTRACTKGARGFTKVINAAGPVVRAAAARALAGYVRYGESREALRKAIEDPDAVVREAAREAFMTPMIKAFGEPVKNAKLLATVEDAATAEAGFAGLLSEVPIDQICQFLEERQESGALYVAVGGSVAEVYLVRGSVVAADYDGRTEQEAFNQFCRWEGMYFFYNPGVASPREGTPQSLIQMLMDACELQDKTERPRPEPQ